MAEKLNDDKAAAINMCCKVEQMIGGIYRLFAEIHKSNDAVAKLWEKTAREEDVHAAQLKMLLGLDNSAIDDVAFDSAYLSEMLNTLGSLLAEFKQNHPGIKKALETAIKLESELADFHARSAVTTKDPKLAKLLDELRLADIGHTVSLKLFYDKFSFK